MQASPKISLSDNKIKLFENVSAEEIFITAKVFFEEKNLDKPEVSIDIARGNKCNRCWKIYDEVSLDEEICKRCSDVIKNNNE